MNLINREDATELVTRYCQEYYNLNPVAVIEKLMELPSVQPIGTTEHCETCRYRNKEWYEEPCDSCTMGGETNHWKPSVKLELATDCISRQAAIDLLRKWSGGYAYIETPTESAVRELEALPSAEPEIIRCRECKHMQEDKLFGQYW